LLLLPLAVLFGGTVHRALSARLTAGKELPAYSVFSGGRDGLAEAARLFRHLGLEPVAVTRPIQFLPSTDRPRLLVLVEPQTGEKEFSEADVRALLRWVEQGNTLLLCGRNGTALHHELGVVLRSDAGAGTRPREVVVGEAGGYTDGVETIVIEGKDAVQAPGGLPLWSQDGEAGAVLLRRGTGRVLVIADPSLLTARGLAKDHKDNFWLLSNLASLHARDSCVYFDEYHHDIRAGGGFWAYLRYHGQLGALLPVLLATGLALWAAAIRLGPAVPIPDAVRADAVEYASALSRIYQRAGTHGLLARSLARDFLAELTRHLRLRRNASADEVLAAWRQRQPGSASELARLLKAAEELRRGDVSEKRLLEWTKAFDQFLNAIK
jgi:hypothetical protein